MKATHDSIIAVGDRVALAPHLDLWMAGIRFGTVESTRVVAYRGKFELLFFVRTDDDRVHAFRSSDLLGAVRALESSEFNHWGTRKSDVGEGYCPECERENSLHYEFCPLRPGAVR